MYAKPDIRIVEAPKTAASCTPCGGSDPGGTCPPTVPTGTGGGGGTPANPGPSDCVLSLNPATAHLLC